MSIPLAGDDGECPEGGPLRRRQERELETRHVLTVAEFALAREAALLSNAFQAANMSFDPRTLIALRILETLVREGIDAVEALQTREVEDLIVRSTRLTAALLFSTT